MRKFAVCRVVTTLLLVLAAPVAFGCGTSDMSNADLISRFHDETGYRLVRDSKNASDSWDTFKMDGVGLEDWGTFTIYLVHQEDGEDILLEDDHGRRIKPDVDGLYWKKTEVPGMYDVPDSHFWSATKRYGSNVYLVWIGGSKRGTGLGASFDRIDSALTAAAK